MTEKGSDELLAEAGATDIDAMVGAEEARGAQEEANLAATPPADDEPGQQYPNPDETPDGEAEEYDPMPPEEPA